MIFTVTNYKTNNNTENMKIIPKTADETRHRAKAKYNLL